MWRTVRKERKETDCATGDKKEVTIKTTVRKINTAHHSYRRRNVLLNYHFHENAQHTRTTAN